MASLDFLFKENLIRGKLIDFNSPLRLCFNDDNFIKSAVVFLIIPYENKPYDLVLIRRTKRNSDKHSGEISFPGGKFDEENDDSLMETALRETEEELGISRGNINILGSFDDHITPKKFIITPFVGYIDENQPLMKEDEEVQEIVKIPVNFFADKKNYKKRNYMLKTNLIEVGKYNYRASTDKKYVVFGATSHLIVNFIELVYDLKLMTPGARRLVCEDFKTRDEKLSQT